MPSGQRMEYNSSMERLRPRTRHRSGCVPMLIMCSYRFIMRCIMYTWSEFDALDYYR